MPVYPISPIGSSYATGAIAPYAPASVVKSILHGTNENNGSFHGVGVTDNDLHVTIHNPLTAFGEVRTIQPIPTFQIDAVYNNEEDLETFTFLGGTAAISGNLFKVSSGTTPFGYGTLRSKRVLPYKPGQSNLIRLTALFSSGSANSLQLAGAGNATDGLYFGRNGTDFGIFHRRHGEMPTRNFRFTTAPTGTQVCTFGIGDGQLFSASVNAGTIFQAAWQIEQSASQFSPYWVPFSNSGSVNFFYNLGAAAATATSSFSSTGNAAGTWTTVATGAAVTSTFYSQSAWTEDPLDGTGDSGMTLDPNKGNVYQVEFQYLGYGKIEFAVENPRSGHFEHVHSIEFANTSDLLTSVRNPNMKALWAAVSLGSTGSINLLGASAAGFIEGNKVVTRNPKGLTGTQNALTSVFQNIVSIRNPAVVASIGNSREIDPIAVSLTNESNKQAEIIIIFDPIPSAAQTWRYTDDHQNVEYDTTLVPYTNGEILIPLTIGAGQSINVNLQQYNIVLSPRSVLMIAGKFPSGGTTPNISWGLNWRID